MRAAEEGGRRTAREEAVTAGMGVAKANGWHARRRGPAAGAADDTAAASGKPTFFICISSHLRPCADGVATHPESGHRSLSSPTRELGRRSGVTDRGIDPEFCDYDPS